MTSLLSDYTIFELALAGIILVTFGIQLYYYLGKYARVATYRQKVSRDEPGVSVIVVLNDDLLFVEQTLPELLMQDYDRFEVVVVDNGSSLEVVEALERQQLRYPHLKCTRINPDPKFKTRRKLALTVGIKAARFPNLIFTQTSGIPASKKWIALMARGFTTGQVVIGYAGIAPQKGITNRLIRSVRLMISLHFLSSAMRGRAYGAAAANMGFTSKIYFDNRGYNYLNLNVGENDLFVRNIANRENTSIIIHPKATVREEFEGGLRRWWSERRYHTYTFRHYPAGVKAGIFLELSSRLLFFVGAAICLVRWIPILWIGAIALLVLRWLAFSFTLTRVCLRLGEKGLFWTLFFYDLIAPFTESLLSLSRKIRPSQGIWS
ncbi:MAG: hypothetical protein LBM20_01135 [Rikenellaceae bacterium]|nr:hypothetical protein [Rikenellaceae bacterium]